LTSLHQVLNGLMIVHVNYRHRTISVSTRLIAISICVVTLLCAPPIRAQEPAEPICASCHDVGKKLKKSAHASVPCAACHVKHEEYPHPANIPKPACATCHERVAHDFSQGVHSQATKAGNAGAPDCETCHGSAHELVSARSAEFRKAVPETCGMCHADIATEYKSSVHGQAVARGVVDAPVCTTCHGEHAILRPQNAASPVYSRNIPATCAQCHGNVRLSRRFGLPPDRVLSFQASIHGMALKSGSQTVANCSSCHGIHDILPSSDAKSTINPKNLAATCGKCHLGAGTRFALGPIHEVPGDGEPKVVGWARAFYFVTIPLVLGLMFLHNFGDWLHKLTRHHSDRQPEPLDASAQAEPDDTETGEFRMFKFERLEHILLVLSFAVLAWTGFALKYPEGWWARPLLAWEISWPVRGTVHRIAAVLFMVVAGMHVVSLLVSGELRRHWKELWPRISDVREGLLNFAYNLGLRRERPPLAPHGYVEKAEYWAVVWGAVVMMITGLMLWANRFTLRWLPKSFSDLATAVHFYEAVLAGLAILIWHFYSVIFDPDVYPMETAWLTGRSVKRKKKEQPEVEEVSVAPPEPVEQSEAELTPTRVDDTPDEPSQQ
jgi:cytochrome b subunit of formate dehydrogenase